MFKNVSLRRRKVQGLPSWVLLGLDGRPIPAFSAFAHSLRNNAQNTLDSYCRHVAEFLDYMIEVSALYEGQMTKLQLAEAIEVYGDFLLMGRDAHHAIARSVATRLPSGVNSPASLIPKKAAIRRFLRLSEVIRQEIEELEQEDALHFRAASDPLLPGLGERRELNRFEVRAMQVNSMLAGVISGGPKLIDCVVMRGGVGEVPYEHNRAFPFDKVIELIRAMPTYRDRALYSLLAASGSRTHESLQLLWEDIDIHEGSIRLVDPNRRMSHASYRALSSEERAQMAWKGRATQLTLLIEPFASEFFHSLEAYMKYEYIAHGKHDFIFQYLVGERRGKPYFLSAASTRLELFRRVCRGVGVELPAGSGKHSLRHMYGTYLLNYFSSEEGEFGLPLPVVQQLLGHSSIKSTSKYARYDQDLLKLKFQEANRILFKSRTPETLVDQKIKFLESQIARLRNQAL